MYKYNLIKILSFRKTVYHFIITSKNSDFYFATYFLLDKYSEQLRKKENY